jgi:hypothetical protein
MKRSPIRQLVEQKLREQGTSFAELARKVLDEGGNADDVMYQVRKLTEVPISVRSAQRWIQATAAAA